MSEMRCKRCGANESRIDGFCSIECRDKFDYEEEITDLEARIAELEAEQRWIPVSERPLESGTFLVLWKNGDIRKDWTFIDGGRYYWWNSGDNVTHWMPLPESPNDTQKDTVVYGKEREE